MDRNLQRQQRRDAQSAFSCTSGAELPLLNNPAARPSASCDPPSVTPEPPPFETLIPCPPEPPIIVNLPPGLDVPNDLAVAYCPSTGGYSVTGTTAVSVTAGSQTQIVLFTSLSNITDNQLNFLYDTVPSSSASIIAAALSGATSSIINLTHLNYDQSEELIINIQTAKFNVNTLAVEQARNLLFCQVENSLQVATCPTSAYFGSTAPLPPALPYVPSATSATGSVLVSFSLLPSTGGQTAFTLINIPSLTAAAAQANNIALAQAESQLRCIFGNDATAAACCTSEAPGNNLGYTYCVPATGPAIPGAATAVGYFSVSANTIFSIVSKEEANSVARELSRNSLNCYFPSEGVTASCTAAATAGYASNSTTSVYLPPGTIILTDLPDSVTAATQQAFEIAQASLNCFWVNDPQSSTCPTSGPFLAINNQTYDLDPSTTASLSFTGSVTGGIVISYISKADANQQALDLASSQLSCSYCNDVVPATCTGGVNETIGASADLICSPLAEIAQNTAISLAGILVTTTGGNVDCCYGNNEVYNNIFCTTGAYRNPGSDFTSKDSFYLSANVITVCQSSCGATSSDILFRYDNLWQGNTISSVICADNVPCGVTGGTSFQLPSLWASQTDLFSAIATGATFYSDTAGTPYSFTVGYPFVTDRCNTLRSYRTVTGGTGFTVGLTAYTCNNFSEYTFRGTTLGNYAGASATLALSDIFCVQSGTSATAVTLYTNSANPFSTGNTSAWYTDACGNSAFNPVLTSATADQYYAGIIDGATAAYIIFSTTGSNVAAYQGLYNLGTCSTGPQPDTQLNPTGGTSCTYPGYSPPSTGTFKQQATDIAQNIVNSFVVCYYFNDPQVGRPCSLGEITLRQGYALAGEIVSNISKEDANTQAQRLADARTVCLNTDEVGGCEGTTISGNSFNVLGKTYNLQFNKSVCDFTTAFNESGSFNKRVVYVANSASIKKLTICTGAGTEDIYVPYWSTGALDGDTVYFLIDPASSLGTSDSFDAIIEE